MVLNGCGQTSSVIWHLRGMDGWSTSLTERRYYEQIVLLAAELASINVAEVVISTLATEGSSWDATITNAFILAHNSREGRADTPDRNSNWSWYVARTTAASYFLCVFNRTRSAEQTRHCICLVMCASFDLEQKKPAAQPFSLFSLSTKWARETILSGHLKCLKGHWVRPGHINVTLRC